MSELRFGLVWMLLVLAACGGPTRRAETLYKQGDNLGALRVARTALRGEPLPEEETKRLRTVLILGARNILNAPDTDSKEDAFELFEALPDGSDERQRAAQRVLRVMARHADVKDLQPALLALEPEMGDESQVRSNLRLIVEQTRGTVAAVWAARTVVERWPDDADRWLDLSGAQAAAGQFDDARRTLLEAEKRLAGNCHDLPMRMAGYDKVRRQSAYGALEVQRCRTFPALAARALAYAQKRNPTAQDLKGTMLEFPEKPDGACPAVGATAVKADWSNPAHVVLLTPAPDAWWLDGVAQDGNLSPLASGKHRVTFRQGKVCASVELDASAGGATALRTEKMDLPADVGRP